MNYLTEFSRCGKMISASECREFHHIMSAGPYSTKGDFRYCSDCGEYLELSEFYTNNRGGYDHVCKFHRNSPQRNYTSTLLASYRSVVIKQYGGKCECCGEDELAFLSLDHIGGRKLLGHDR